MTDGPRLPPPWRPVQDGERVEGFVISVSAHPSKYDTEVTVIVLDTGVESISVWCSPTGLREMIDKVDPQPGEYLTLIYDGSKLTKKGHTLKFYSYEKMTA